MITNNNNELMIFDNLLYTFLSESLPRHVNIFMYEMDKYFFWIIHVVEGGWEYAYGWVEW